MMRTTFGIALGMWLTTMLFAVFPKAGTAMDCAWFAIGATLFAAFDWAVERWFQRRRGGK